MDISLSNACFFTGHRVIPEEDIPNIRNLLLSTCTLLITKYGVTDFITGGALGFDTLAARIVLELKQKYDIRLHIFIPCSDQAKRWSAEHRKTWEDINNAADSVRAISETTYTPGCMQKRNKAMVDSALFGVAYCTKISGGTYSTLHYASAQKRSVIVFTDRRTSLGNISCSLVEI